MLKNKKALLLDMNGTFMFGEDRFGRQEDFSVHYAKIGGKLSADRINTMIRDIYKYLDVRYPDEKYHHVFPSVENAIREVVEDLDEDEMVKVVNTFAFHELGYIPDASIAAIRTLHQHFLLGAVIDIWSPKAAWLDAFKRAGILSLFSAISFSSDHGWVKPSPRAFEWTLEQMDIVKEETVMIGDSVRRDLGGANAAGIDCVLVGGKQHPDALMHCEDLSAFVEIYRKEFP